MVKSILVALIIVVTLVLQVQPSASQTARGQVVGGDPPVGWNYFTVGYCASYGDSILYVVTHQGVTLSVSDIDAWLLLAGACQTGNTIGVYFVTTSVWTVLYVYPH
jgi:hypothetical protein